MVLNIIFKNNRQVVDGRVYTIEIKTHKTLFDVSVSQRVFKELAPQIISLSKETDQVSCMSNCTLERVCCQQRRSRSIYWGLY